MAAIAVDGVVKRSVIDQLARMEEVRGIWQIQLPNSRVTPDTAEAEVDLKLLERAT